VQCFRYSNLRPRLVRADTLKIYHIHKILFQVVFAPSHFFAIGLAFATFVQLVGATLFIWDAAQTAYSPPRLHTVAIALLHTGLGTFYTIVWVWTSCSCGTGNALALFKNLRFLWLFSMQFLLAVFGTIPFALWLPPVPTLLVSHSVLLQHTLILSDYLWVASSNLFVCTGAPCVQ
jgi:hypothetical protein